MLIGPLGGAGARRQHARIWFRQILRTIKLTVYSGAQVTCELTHGQDRKKMVPSGGIEPTIFALRERRGATAPRRLSKSMCQFGLILRGYKNLSNAWLQVLIPATISSGAEF